MAVLKKSTMKDQIYQIIKKKILTQQYKLGEKINIQALAQELNVSNTPVREALAMLEMEGLVEITPNTGPHVIDFTPQALLDISEAVQILMMGSYELCVNQGKTENLAKTFRLRLEEQKKAIDAATDHEFVKATIACDECILTITQNKRLVSLYYGLFGVWFLTVLYDQQNQGLDRQTSTDQHEEILNAMEAEDHVLAKQLLAKHYDMGHHRHVKKSK